MDDTMNYVETPEDITARQSLNFDITEGVRVYGWKGNESLGDCVEAEVMDLRQLKHLHNAGRLERLYCELHGLPKRDRYTISTYVQYLKTLGEQPGPTVGSSPTGFLEYERQQGRITEWASIELGPDRALTAVQAANRYHGALLTLMLTEDMYQGFFERTPWNIDTPPGNVPLGTLIHEVALVRSVDDYLVAATWDQNKLMTIPCANACIVWVNVFLTDDDSWDPEYSLKVNELTTMRTATNAPA